MDFDADLVPIENNSVLMIGELPRFFATGLLLNLKDKINSLILYTRKGSKIYSQMMQEFEDSLIIQNKDVIFSLVAFTFNSENEIFWNFLKNSQRELRKGENIQESTGENEKKEPEKELGFSLENLSEVFFTIQDSEDGVEVVENDDPVYAKIQLLLKKGYPEAELILVAKKYYEDRWQEYLAARNGYNRSDLRESLLFFESTKDPADLGEIKINIEDLQPNLRESISPKINKCYVTNEGEFGILIYVVLSHIDRPNEIIDHYPAYYLVFV